MIKAVIFDLDDTLISEFAYVKSGFKIIAGVVSNKYNLDEGKIYILLLKLFAENPYFIFNRMYKLNSIKYTADDILILVELYRKHIPEISFYEDVIPCLIELRESNYKLGIITDGYRVSQNIKLEKVDARKWFDEIIITDELGSTFWKPHTLPFELMKEKLNVEYNEMIYIGDNPKKDFYIKKTYQINTIRLNRQGVYATSKYLGNIREDYTIYSLLNLTRVIELINE